MAYTQQSNSPHDPNRIQTHSKSKKRFILPAALIGLFLIFVAAIFLSYISFRLSSSEPGEAPPVGSGAPPPSQRLPEFPWPPRASALTKLPSQYVVSEQGQTTFKQVADKLEMAFKRAGYGQTGYYAVPGGFALVSQLEQFKANGLPANDPYRWSEDVEIPPVFSIEYLSDLVRGKVGRYRVIVFAVSDDFFSQESGKTVGIAEARTIAIHGANLLPPEVGNLPYTDRHTCTALIYEFEKRYADQPGEFKDNSTLMAETHLQKILPYLQR